MQQQHLPEFAESLKQKLHAQFISTGTRSEANVDALNTSVVSYFEAH